MKVICIEGVSLNTPNVWGASEATVDELLYEGRVYTVTAEVNFGGFDGFLLLGKPVTTAYQKRRFIPCSEIDEMELVNEMAEVNHI